MENPRVDVVLNVFAKPYQTSLSVLSLLQMSKRHIDRIFFQFEPSGSMYDAVQPYVIAEYLAETMAGKVAVYQPKYWLHLDAADKSRLADPEYRFSLRYQHAFENTDKRHLFVMHNDVLIKKDIIGAMLERLDGAFAIGHIGQCWNCPARDETLVRAAGCGDTACSSTRYQDFRPDFAGLSRLYRAAVERGVFVRPYWQDLARHYGEEAWPLPECRVNEWGCLIDVAQVKPHVIPHGPILPFGAYEQCGVICLDIDVAWFRDLHRKGLFARHMDLAPYLTHWVGTGKVTEYRYKRAEGNARGILEKNFAPFVRWCREKGNKMFN